MFMKKALLFLMSLMLMSGCSNSAQLDQIKLDTYTSIYTDILNASDFKTESDYFSIEFLLADLGNSSYRYDVIIDQAKVAMYNVEILVIVDDGSLVISDKMMPSVGIFEDITYYMIPYQVNTAAHYIEGIALNGVASNLPVRLKAVVKWKDDINKPFIEYFDFSLVLPSVPTT
jgi:uncharacterized protein YceK